MKEHHRKESPILSLLGLGGGVGGGLAGGQASITELPLYTSQGASNLTTTNKTGTRNAGTNLEVNYYLQTSNNVPLNNSTSSDTHNYYARRSGTSEDWYIAANFSAAAGSGLTRWSGRNKINFASPGLSYTLPDGSSITATSKRDTGQISGTGAGVIQTGYGNFEYDATNFTNGSGDGFANWYADSNQSTQKYRGIILAIYNEYDGSKQISKFDSVSQGDGNGGALWWKPPQGTSEIWIDFANSHSNSRCSVTCWDDNSGQIVWTLQYGNFGTVNIGNTLGDSSARSIVATHNDGFVYFHIDHDGTIAGSHYYMYR